MSLVVLLFLFLALFGFGAWSEAPAAPSASETQACMVTVDNVERCSPTLIDDLYQLPDDGVVLEMRVNNGPVAPDSQEGFEIVLEADGTATITEMPMGSSEDLSASQRTAEQIVRTDEIGVDGVQELLSDLEHCGFYYLPQRDEVDPSELPDGGGISIIEVSLVDGTWEVFNQAVLEPADQYAFDGCESVVARTFDLNR